MPEGPEVETRVCLSHVGGDGTGEPVSEGGQGAWVLRHCPLGRNRTDEDWERWAVGAND